MAEDYIQKGVLILQHQNGKCRLKKANDVARVILAAARGWQSRTTELKNALKAKKLAFPFDTLSSECKTLIDDYIDHMVIVSCLAILTLQALCSENPHFKTILSVLYGRIAGQKVVFFDEFNCPSLVISIKINAYRSSSFQ